MNVRDTWAAYFRAAGLDWTVQYDSDSPGMGHLVITDSDKFEWIVPLWDEEDGFIMVGACDIEHEWASDTVPSPGSFNSTHGSTLFTDDEGYFTGTHVRMYLRVPMPVEWYEGDKGMLVSAAMGTRFAIETDGVLVKASIAATKKAGEWYVVE